MKYGQRELTSTLIRSKVSDFDMFSYYCTNFKKIGESFKSDLRSEDNASCSIQSWNGWLFYKDFSTGDSYNIFGYLQIKFNIDFISTLSRVSIDFNLGLTRDAEELPSMLYFGIPDKRSSNIAEKTPTRISTQIREWSAISDSKFWKDRFQLTVKDLKKYNVFPLKFFWINDRIYSCKDNTYGYYFGIIDGRERWKIYQPYELRSTKWFSNADKGILQGEDQLPWVGDLLIITSSLKDVLVLNKLGYNAVAPGSESSTIDLLKINTLKSRFKQVVLFYNNDEPGLRASDKHKKLYECKDITIPLIYQEKDPSDFVEQHGYALLEEIIKNELYYD